MIPDKVLGSLGMCQKAGRMGSGEFMTEQSVKAGKSWLVIVATDASDATKKNFKDMCAFYEVPYAEYGTKDSLGHALGKEVRASLSVNDEGFAKAIRKKMETLV